MAWSGFPDAAKFEFVEVDMLDKNGFDLWADGYDNSGDEWDDDEIYCVADELKTEFTNLAFEKVTFCSGFLMLPG